MDTGDSHAPCPLYFSTAGYGVLVDTARYATFYCGGNELLNARKQTDEAGGIRLTEAELLQPEKKESPPRWSSIFRPRRGSKSICFRARRCSMR